MKRILCLLLLSSYLYSGELEDNNLQKISEVKKGEQIITTIGNGDTRGIVVRSMGKLTEAQERIIVKTYQTFYNWDEFDIRDAELVFEGNSLSIIFQLNTLVYKEIDIAPFLPSGIQLYYETFFEYDFRMFKDSLFMRLKGQYYSKEEFLEELYKAVSDPILYIQIHDPSYIIRQIDELRTTNNEQSKLLFELEERHEKLLTDFTSLVKNYTELLEAYNTTTKEKDLLTNGVISLANRSFFGSLGEYDRAVVDRVIELKTSNPNLLLKECVTNLKAEGLKVSNKTVEAVYIVYFGEFPQNPVE